MWKSNKVNRDNSNKWILKIGVWVCLSFICFCSQAAPLSELWPYWEGLQGNMQKKVDHQVWDAFLSTYWVKTDTEIARFDYQKVSVEDKKNLLTYLDYLQNIAIRQYSRDEQLAYWMNLYNAATIWLVLEKKPTRSIREIKFSWFAFGPWSHKWLTVEGQKISLDDIEHRILRPIWKMPLIHFGLNCASLGCPDLLQRAFLAETAMDVLKSAEREFIQKRAWRFDGNTLIISSIFKWFAVDFGGEEHIINYLAARLPSSVASRLLSYQGRIKYEYDWSLNQP